VQISALKVYQERFAKKNAAIIFVAQANLAQLVERFIRNE
jgi:hypothetical protein